MSQESTLREFAHRVVENADPAKILAILELLDEDFFSAQEIKEIRELAESNDWTDWRKVRREV